MCSFFVLFVRKKKIDGEKGRVKRGERDRKGGKRGRKKRGRKRRAEKRNARVG